MATDTVSVKIEGLQTIDAALRELSEAVRGEILTDALLAGGEVLKDATAQRIHGRTGRTAADLRVVVTLEAAALAGTAEVGARAPIKGDPTARGWILNFLERGTQAHVIPRKTRAPRISITIGGRTVTRRGQAPKAKGPMAFDGKVFARVNHPGTQAQAPMRIALGQAGPQAIKAFSQTAWDGIRAIVVKR